MVKTIWLAEATRDLHGPSGLVKSGDTWEVFFPYRSEEIFLYKNAYLWKIGREEFAVNFSYREVTLECEHEPESFEIKQGWLGGLWGKPAEVISEQRGMMFSSKCRHCGIELKPIWEPK